jgi:hypothetical protein
VPLSRFAEGRSERRHEDMRQRESCKRWTRLLLNFQSQTEAMRTARTAGHGGRRGRGKLFRFALRFSGKQQPGGDQRGRGRGRGRARIQLPSPFLFPFPVLGNVNRSRRARGIFLSGTVSRQCLARVLYGTQVSEVTLGRTC